MYGENDVKILVVGDPGVGKSSIVQRFISKSFSAKHIGTVGIKIFSKTIRTGSKEANLRVFDSSGSEFFRLMRPGYYREAEVVLLVYDVTSYSSFHSILDWYQKAAEHANKFAIYHVVGNKCDRRETRKISAKRGEKYAKENGFLFMETSAKLDLNIEELFQKVTDIIMSPTPRPIICGLAKETHIKSHKAERNLRLQPRPEVKKKSHKAESNLRLQPRPEVKKKCCEGNCLWRWLFR